jgi:hypothetical protein
MVVSFAVMKPYFGLRGTALNIMISIIAGLDFLYVNSMACSNIGDYVDSFHFPGSSVMISMLT